MFTKDTSILECNKGYHITTVLTLYRTCIPAIKQVFTGLIWKRGINACHVRLWKGMVVTWKRKIAGINLLFQARLRIT